MSYESKEVTVLPSGLFWTVKVEDGYVYSSVCDLKEDGSSHGDRTHVVEGHDWGTPWCLGASFRRGGWCDLLVCDAKDVASLGGFSEIESIKAGWAES